MNQNLKTILIILCVIYVVIDLGTTFYCKNFECTKDDVCKREFMESYYNKYGSLDGFFERAAQVQYVKENGTLEGFIF